MGTLQSIATTEHAIADVDFLHSCSSSVDKCYVWAYNTEDMVCNDLLNMSPSNAQCNELLITCETWHYTPTTEFMLLPKRGRGFVAVGKAQHHVT